MEQNKVDLSKAKAGDTVVFRCGGQAPIGKINQWETPDIYQVYFGDNAWPSDYGVDGYYIGESYEHAFDITSVIPAPVAFDWKDAKWGMVYKSHDNQLWAYVGQNPYNKERSVFVAHVNGHYVVEWGKDEAKLTRAPEHAMIGRWAGDRILVQGDYAERTDQGFVPQEELEHYTDISADVQDMLKTIEASY